MDLNVTAERMMSYLPMFWHENLEMQQILQSQGFEIDGVDDKGNFIFSESYIMTCSESRLEEWEKWLKIIPNGSVEDRRLTVLAYFSVIAKLSRTSIKSLVSVLYNGARADVLLRNSTIKVIISPLPEHFDDDLDLSKLLKQLESRKPCHLGVSAERFYTTWGDIRLGFNDWSLLKTDLSNWEKVILYILE